MHRGISEEVFISGHGLTRDDADELGHLSGSRVKLLSTDAMKQRLDPSSAPSPPDHSPHLAKSLIERLRRFPPPPPPLDPLPRRFPAPPPPPDPRPPRSAGLGAEVLTIALSAGTAVVAQQTVETVLDWARDRAARTRQDCKIRFYDSQGRVIKEVELDHRTQRLPHHP